jgi:peptide deformylase
MHILNTFLKRASASDAAFVTLALAELAANMLYTIGSNEKHRDPIGVGPAAPQVSAPIRLVVIAAMGIPGDGTGESGNRA